MYNTLARLETVSHAAEHQYPKGQPGNSCKRPHIVIRCGGPQDYDAGKPVVSLGWSVQFSPRIWLACLLTLGRNSVVENG